MRPLLACGLVPGQLERQRSGVPRENLPWILEVTQQEVGCGGSPRSLSHISDIGH